MDPFSNELQYGYIIHEQKSGSPTQNKNIVKSHFKIYVQKNSKY